MSRIDLRLDHPFYWRGKPQFKTSIVYSVSISSIKPVKGIFQKDILKQSHKDLIKQLRTLFNFDYTVYRDDRQRQNDRVWQRVLQYPPTHRIEIAAHTPNSKQRLIFSAIVNLKGFRWLPHHCAIAIGRFITSFVCRYKFNYLLVQCPDADQWYWQLILARCRELLKPEGL